MSALPDVCRGLAGAGLRMTRGHLGTCRRGAGHLSVILHQDSAYVMSTLQEAERAKEHPVLRDEKP